jgi:type I restriction enzyme M protein
MVNEAKTHDLVRDIFNSDKLRDTFILEREKSDNPIIQKLLKTASKRGNGNGRPDLIISFPEIPKLVIIIECKADIKKHRSKNENKYSEYAVDGVKLYSQYLCREYNVLSIAVSGEEQKKIKVSNFLQIQNEEIRELNTKQILSIKDYLRLFREDKEREELEYKKLMKYSRELNNYLREELKVSEKDRALLVSGILLALDDNGFRKAYPEQESSEFLAEYLLETIEKRLKKEKIPEEKRGSMVRNYSFIKDLSIIKNKKLNKLYELISQIHDNVHFFIEEYKFNYDIIGAFYGEFLRYANGDKSLGIVLTPRHITDLFVDLVNVKKSDVIYDNCCGTGGFIISSMKKMIEDAEEDSEEIDKIKNERLIGVEADGKMFTLGCANMILMKDGKSNFYNDDGLRLSEKVNKIHKPTVGFLNPPYSQKKPTSEFNFILANLNALEKNSLCVAIVPMSCAIGKNSLKEKILENNTLEAVMSMPDELFYPVGTVTCIMVFRAGIKHDSDVKTWFGYWKNDGFVKLKKEGRVDANNKWKEIRAEWLDNYKNKNEIAGKCIKANVGAVDEWCAEAYLETDYSSITKECFEQTLREYVAFNVKEGINES